MSRIGKNPVAIPSGVEVTITENTIAIKGSKGELSLDFDTRMSVSQEENEIVVTRK